MIELAEQIARAVGHPRRQGVLHHLGHRGQRGGAAAGLDRTAGRNQVLALRNSYHGRSFATMGVTGNRGWSASSLSPFNVHYVHGGYRFRSPFRHLDDAGVHRRLRRRPARRDRHHDRGRRRLHDRRADPGRRRVHRAARRAASAPCQEVLRRARHPVHHRRGADRAGAAPASTSGATRRTASCPTCSPSPRASATACRWPASSRAAEIMDSLPGQLASRPSAATRWSSAGAPRQPALPARPRPAGQRRCARASRLLGRAAARWPTARRWSARCGARA